MRQRCPVCGEWPDTCLGHGFAADPGGHVVLRKHIEGDHRWCEPIAECEEAASVQ